MLKILRPQFRHVVTYLAVITIAGVAVAGTLYVSGLRTRIGALENQQTPPAVTAVPTPPQSSPSSSTSPDDGPSQVGPDDAGSNKARRSVVAAAPGGRDSADSRSPRQPSTGGSSQSPSTPRPPAAAAPAEPADDCSARLLALCVRASLLSGD